MHIIYYGLDGEAAKARAAEIRAGKEPAQVRHAQFFDQPEKADAVTILDCVSDYDRARISAAYEIDEADAVFLPLGLAGGKEKTSEPLGTDSGDQFSDEQLRAAITTATGKAPHPQTGRKKLIAQFNALNAAAE